MFSGIVETIGKIKSIQESEQIKRFTIQAPSMTIDMHIGDSIAVNGVCLTVVEFNHEDFIVEVVPETLRCTNLGFLTNNHSVNLERSITANQRLGGHFVQGHVDSTCQITSIQIEGDAWIVEFTLPTALKSYVINKGFITLDGMSITVIKANTEKFSVTLIPHTRAVTIAQFYQVGQHINLEVDMLAKYVEKILRGQNNE